MAMIRNPRFAKARIIGGLLFFVSSSVLIGAVIYIQLENGEANKTILTLIFAAGAGNVTERPIDISDGSVVILNSRRTDAEEIRQNLSRDARTRGLCLQSSAPTAGFNYSKGTPLSLVILREAPC